MDFFASRRQLLTAASVIGIGAAGATALTGCTDTEPDPAEPNANLASTLRHARHLHAVALHLREEGELDAETWQFIIDDHAAHIETLERLTRPAVVDDTLEVAEEDVPVDVDSFREATSVAVEAAVEDCLAVEGDLATVVAEIAACRFGHLRLLS
ncbi:hypothetical protein [Natronoglycomyces albus]|uniref:Uncharacterized protein n=1 Tax=Natronoglycomyces albus TaxID=2811108 RepID=A0A895XRU2_9ACTN|nr:hypothetical protein [Natronoglycomyces albus]QSB06243.1 hypothetical protein JQS30_04865 [Natronoglycomyces albus]